MREDILRRALLPAVLLCCVACQPAQPSAPPTSAAPEPTSDTAPPPAPKPARTADCPYLSGDEVADANGQHVGSVRISSGEPVACFFYRPDGTVQLRTRIYRGPLDTARALVDIAAPVRTSAKAELPGGWSGGAQPTDAGAVYAVARASGGDSGTAIIVHTNQAQSVKAREITKLIIAAVEH